MKGHTLVDALEKVVQSPKRQDKRAFRMPGSAVYKIKGVGNVVTGRSTLYRKKERKSSRNS